MKKILISGITIICIVSTCFILFYGCQQGDECTTKSINVNAYIGFGNISSVTNFPDLSKYPGYWPFQPALAADSLDVFSGQIYVYADVMIDGHKADCNSGATVDASTFYQGITSGYITVRGVPAADYPSISIDSVKVIANVNGIGYEWDSYGLDTWNNYYLGAPVKLYLPSNIPAGLVDGSGTAQLTLYPCGGFNSSTLTSYPITIDASQLKQVKNTYALKKILSRKQG
jgi:hypothetical protein